MNTAYVNLSVYPIDNPDTALYRRLIEEQRAHLTRHGMINLQNFLTPEGIQCYRREIDERMDIAFHASSTRQPYGYYPSADHPQDHPLNTFAATESFRLARHHVPDTQLDELYCWEPLRRFIADITGNNTIFLSADPSNGLVIQVYREGCGQAWHFDQALFSTIINLGESENGGIFECTPGIRTEEDPNYDEVKKVLSGESEHIQKHKVKAGSFTIMLGRYTMHRVTPVEQETPRVSVVLSYELQPNIFMDLDTRKKSFGPSAPEYPQ